AEPIRVEPEEAALAIEDRAARRTRSEGGGVLDAACDLASARSAECPRDRGHGTEGHPRATARRRGRPEHERPGRGRTAAGPAGPPGLARVDRDAGEVTVPVDTRELPTSGAPVGKCDRDLVATDVVGIGQDPAVGDDDARPALARADADNG